MSPKKRASTQRKRRDAARPATYGGALRMMRLLHGLHERPHGWSFDGICDELGISERTLLRYIAACRKELLDRHGRPLVEVTRRGDRRVVRLADDARPVDATVYQVLFLYFSLAVFQFLEGTVIRDGVEGLWERFAKSLPRRQGARLEEFTRKFFVVPYAMKDYREHDEHLDVIVQALVDQRRIRVDYAGLLGDGKVHEFEPYTLAMYRGGLYLIGRSHRGKRIVKLAVERIRAIDKLPERFDYPRDYSPEKHTEGVFGIIEGDERNVELLVHGPETEAYLRSRRIHPTQKLRRRRDGVVVLTMTVRGTEELRNWVLSFGPYLEVVKPKSLRDEVAASLRQATARYG
jgi:predicted DNA-binding transcriptional regulator YafY